MYLNSFQVLTEPLCLPSFPQPHASTALLDHSAGLQGASLRTHFALEDPASRLSTQGRQSIFVCLSCSPLPTCILAASTTGCSVPLLSAFAQAVPSAGIPWASAFRSTSQPLSSQLAALSPLLYTPSQLRETNPLHYCSLWVRMLKNALGARIRHPWCPEPLEAAHRTS